MTTYAVFFDPLKPGLYVGGISRVFAPRTLSATVNPDGTIEIWLGSNVNRILGPIAYTYICDQHENTFASAELAWDYLTAQFNRSEVTTEEFVASTDGQQIRTYDGPLPGIVMVLINGLRQSSSAFSIAGNVLTLPDSLVIQAGDLVQVSY